jgi:hypothetical protein
MRDDISASPDFKTAATEGQWSIVMGGIPVNLHLENKGLGWFDSLNEIAKDQNHNYIEIRGPDNQVFRRIQTYEPDMLLVGEMMCATYGSEGTDFSKDTIYHDDPNLNVTNMLRSGDDPDQSGKIFTGTKEQVLSIYHQGLVGVINGNKEGFFFNAVGGNQGNTLTAEILEKMQEAGHKMGLKVGDFDPKGKDIAFDKNVFDLPEGQAVCFSSEQELIDAITVLETIISQQHEKISAFFTPLRDINSEIPEEAKLTCPPDHNHNPLKI